MNTYIIFFRGINVGGKNLLPMKELKKSLEEEGFEGVKSYIQSGNVVLQSGESKAEKVASKIGLVVKRNHGFQLSILVLDINSLYTAIRNNPFSTEEGKSLHFYFLNSQPQKPKMDALLEKKVSSEKCKLKNKVFYLFAPNGIGRSKLAANIESSLGVPVTARNWNTVSKVFALANE